ncbi:hypothetical protein [Burkholderia sp. F1]|uniref:hypothetical protein n=1 Tax=Burkholderia sp. F1 TaxID=3366817 RepID=UPI003D74BD19
MRNCTQATCTSLQMIRKSIGAIFTVGRTCGLGALALGLGAWVVPAMGAAQDADGSTCHAIHMKRVVTLSGQYAVDYDDEAIGSDVWFTEDDASAKRLPDRSQRSGVLVFTNRSDAARRLRIPAERPRGVCRLEGTAKIAIRELETTCPGQEAPDHAVLERVVSASAPKRVACDASAR